MFGIVYTKSARKALKAMQPKKAKHIRQKLQEIAANPYGEHPQVKALQGRDGFRLRVGDWRVIYTLHDNELVVQVLAIAPRGDVYKH